MSRTKNSIRNIFVAMIGQGLGIIVSFIARIFFIQILGAEYLGINGLFTNILTILSLVELGIGPAIVFSLYKPLAVKDLEKVKALMQLYKKAYITIGVIVAAIGIAITPFLNVFIKEVPDVPNLEIIFILFVINAAVSYFFAYKRNLIIADQYRHIATIYRYGYFILLNILQIIFLYLTSNFIVFLSLQILCTLFENLAVSRKADKMYSFLKQKDRVKLDKETINEVKKNTGAMIFHKIGGIVVNSTDNIIISAKVGVIWVGLYSNYLLIINALNTIIGQLFVAITASAGNLAATENKEKSLSVFHVTFFVNFWIYGFVSICLYYLFNPFINIWLGKDLLMSQYIVVLLVINFYIQGMRKSVLTFRDALGLYWNDRYKPIFEVVINLVVSLILASRIGIAGVFIGTIASTLTICCWIEPYVLYKHGFNNKLKPYFFKYFVYGLSVVFVGGLTGVFVQLINGDTILVFLYKLLICIIVPNLLFFIMYFRSKEFTYLIKVLKKGTKDLLKRNSKNR